MAKPKYEFSLLVEQKTDGKVDGRTVVEEFSTDLTVHSIKTQVFTEELTTAIAKATKRLTDMAIGLDQKK